MGRGYDENPGIGYSPAADKCCKGRSQSCFYYCYCRFWALFREDVSDVSMVEGVVRVGKGRVSVGRAFSFSRHSRAGGNPYSLAMGKLP